MTAWQPEEDDSGAELPDEEEPPSQDGDGDEFDDIPSTHMEDDEYDRFVASEIDSQGRVKGDPPVTAILLGLTAAILIVWILFFR
jgi:hypothetical protein